MLLVPHNFFEGSLTKHGLIDKKSCDDALWVLTNAIQKHKEHVAYIDLKAAYDKFLFKILGIYFFMACKDYGSTQRDYIIYRVLLPNEMYGK